MPVIRDIFLLSIFDNNVYRKKGYVYTIIYSVYPFFKWNHSGIFIFVGQFIHIPIYKYNLFQYDKKNYYSINALLLFILFIRQLCPGFVYRANIWKYVAQWLHPIF